MTELVNSYNDEGYQKYKTTINDKPLDLVLQIE
jgi:hypothetical protein